MPLRDKDINQRLTIMPDFASNYFAHEIKSRHKIDGVIGKSFRQMVEGCVCGLCVCGLCVWRSQIDAGMNRGFSSGHIVCVPMVRPLR